MSESMSISVNGQCRVPPGFRFHPTEEELLLYYLRKKVSSEKIDLDVIRDVDLNKLEPWDIQEKCKIGSSPQNDWYLFSHKDKKYPSGTRTNRATAAGFWKATGRDKQIYSNGKRIGMRKTLVFYRGRAPYGQKSKWIMHEYRLDDTTSTSNTNFVSNNVMGDAAHEEGWVVCRTFKKKNYLKGVESPLASSSIISGETRRSNLYDSCDEGALEQILHQTGRGSREENHEEASDYNNGTRSANNNNNNSNNNWYHDDPIIPEKTLAIGNKEGSVTNWATMDRMVAFQLNGESDEGSRQLACFNDDLINMGYCTGAGQHYLQFPSLQSSSTPTHSMVAAYEYGTDPITQNFTSEIDLWNFAPTPTTSSFLSTSAPTPVEYSSVIQ